MSGPARSTLVIAAAITLIVLVLGLRWLDRDAGAGVPAAGDAPAGRTATGAGHAAPAAYGADSGASDPAGASARADGASLERAPAAPIVVHVTGAVRDPGVYRLRDGARVADAVARAGGAARNADEAALNLAAKLVDGQQVLLPRRGASRSPSVVPGAAPGTGAAGGATPGAGPAADDGSPGTAPAGAPISLASATLEQLDTLDGVGPVTAQKILDWRAKSGGFTSVDDLAQIPGIGPKKLASLRTQVVP